MEREGQSNEIGKRRSWTEIEERTMVGIMEELVIQGHKCDGGTFRAGTVEVIAKRMNEKFPNCGIIAKHVANKNKRLKEKYSAVVDMLNQSGFGWNETKKCVEVASTQVLDDYLKRHPNQQNMRGKSFPLFDNLKTIFGKDRATGNIAESPADALEEMEAEVESTSNQNVLPNNNQCEASMSMGHSTEKKRRREEKRSREELYGELIGSFNRGMDMVREDLNSIASKICGNIESKGKIVEELEKMSLTEEEQIDAAIKLADKNEYINLFWASTGYRREAFVKRILTCPEEEREDPKLTCRHVYNIEGLTV